MNIAILGSTGSIGTQTIEAVRELNRYNESLDDPQISVIGLAAGTNVELIAHQALEFNTKFLSVACEDDAKRLKECISELDPDFKADIFYGEEGLVRIAECGADMLFTAVVGMMGLEPTLAAIRKGTHIALANKETLVAGGSIVMKAASEYGVKIIPVDSEHSAIFQCLHGNNACEKRAFRKIFLTASGGPFRGMSFDELNDMTPEDTMKHPTWSMGSKITVDSATLMNKGLEVIEAMHLFDISHNDIEVIVHPQSIVHSMVAFRDGSVMAQLGCPDMKVPIRLALTYPERAEAETALPDFTEIGSLTFEKPDTEAFPCLKLALHAAEMSGTMPAVMNAANEVAVGYFLKKHIKFNDIQYNIGKVMDRHLSSSECPFIKNPSLEEIVAADRWARAAIGGI